MNLFLLSLIIAINLARFVGLDVSPPGFYVDEAAGAAQVICLQQTGSDFFNHPYPLFVDGFEGGFYTPIFIYGEYLWSALLGHSVAAFRSFSALATCLTILFLCLWVRGRQPTRPEDGTRLALWVALSASVMPWASLFSRIAWDPPLSALFLVMALWASGLPSGLRSRLMPGLFLALAAYSYPPMRVIAVAFWLLLPSRTWREKLWDLALFVLICTPLLIHTLDSEFTARGVSLTLWSNNPENPYANADIPGLLLGFLHQMLEHLSLPFLFLSGDGNLRHSIQSTGMLSWLDGYAWLGGIALALLVTARRAVWERFPPKEILFIALLGALLGLVPAALTWEATPHALRAISAWPFLALLSGYLLTSVEQQLRQQWPRLHTPWVVAASVIAIGFFGFYQYHLFTDYRVAALPWFQSEAAPLAQAYARMVDEGQSCAGLPR